jgi:two-component system, LytTR family, response regulator
MSKPESSGANGQPERLERIPIRRRNEVTLVPVHQVSSIVADGELLHIVTLENERYTLNYRLKDLEVRLDPARFVRLSRGALVNLDQLRKIVTLPGGLHRAVLANGQELPISRIQARQFRDRLLKL